MAKDYKGSLTGAQIDALPGKISAEETRATAAEGANATNIANLDTKVGSLDSLTTTNKTSVVSAINECKSGTTADKVIDNNQEGKDQQTINTELWTELQSMFDAVFTQVNVTIKYGDTFVDTSLMADEISVSIDGVDLEQYSLTEHKTVTFSQMQGKKVKIVFPTLANGTLKDDDGNVLTDNTIEFTCDVAVHNVIVKYCDLKPVYLWVMLDGTTLEIDHEFTDTEKNHIAGLYCDFVWSTDATTGTVVRMSDKDIQFVIPKSYLSNCIVTSWGNDTIDFNCLVNVSEHSTAFSNSIDGNTLTNKVLLECESRGVTCNIVSVCKSTKYTIGDETKSCFVPSYAQMYLICQNSSSITKVVKNTLSITPVNYSSVDYMWTLCEESGYSAISLYYGRFHRSNDKVYNLKVVPLIYYSL